MLTYDAVAFETKLVKVFKLGLALVKLVQICLFQGDARVRFVHLDAKLILNPLYSQVLSQRSELVIHIDVVCRLLIPFGFQKFQRLLEHRLWPHLRWIGCLRKSEVMLFYHRASTFDG